MDRPKSFLFVTIEGGGNVPPVLGTARRLAERGHRVRVLTEPCLQAMVEQGGLEFLSFSEHFTRNDRRQDFFGDWKATPFSNPAFENVVFGPAEIVVRQTHAALAATPTDVLVADCLLFSSLVAAEALDLPRAVLFHMPEYLPGPSRPPGVMGLVPGKGLLGRWRDWLLGRIFSFVFNQGLPKINAARKMLLLPPLSDAVELVHQADRRLIMTSQAFDFPLDPAPPNVRYTGPVLDDPDWVSPWENPWPADDDRPLVVVSFSSTFQNQRAVIEHCIEALSSLPVRGLVTLGLALGNEQFEVPQNVVVVASAPHAQVFPQADLVITHAGHGTVMRALASGLPLICLPMGRDQNDNAAKVSYLRAGIRLSPQAKPSKIRQAIVSILENQEFREHAARLQAAILADVQKEAALDELEALAGKGKLVSSSIPL